MKFFRLDLLTLLISLFILNSCKNENTIGIASGTGTISGSLLVDTNIYINTVSDDNVVTSGITNVPLGYFVDPVMGTTTSNIITDLNLPGGGVTTNTSYTIPTGTIYIDSAVLCLKYATTGFYGDSLTSKYKVNVYQLGQLFGSTQNYYANSTWTYDSSTILGSRSFYVRTHDTITIDTPLSGAPDKKTKVAPQIRIRLDTNYARNLLFVDHNQLATNVLFQSYAKGFYISLDQNQQGAGGIMMLTAPGDSSLEVHIRNIDGSTVDTSVLYMNISQHAAQISHGYSAVINTVKRDSTNHNDSLIYLQGLSSLRAKVSFPNIKNLIASLGGNVVINRAELVLTAAPQSDIPAYLTPQRTLSFYRLDAAHQRVSVEDADSSDPRSYSNAVFGGNYSLTTRQYHFLLTSYIQDLIDGNTTDYGAYIAPIDNASSTTVAISATPETAGRAIVVGNVAGSTSPLAKYRVVLNVIYTKTK